MSRIGGDRSMHFSNPRLPTPGWVPRRFVPGHLSATPTRDKRLVDDELARESLVQRRPNRPGPVNPPDEGLARPVFSYRPSLPVLQRWRRRRRHASTDVRFPGDDGMVWFAEVRDSRGTRADLPSCGRLRRRPDGSQRHRAQDQCDEELDAMVLVTLHTPSTALACEETTSPTGEDRPTDRALRERGPTSAPRKVSVGPRGPSIFNWVGPSGCHHGDPDRGASSPWVPARLFGPRLTSSPASRARP